MRTRAGLTAFEDLCPESDQGPRRRETVKQFLFLIHNIVLRLARRPATKTTEGRGAAGSPNRHELGFKVASRCLDAEALV
jgi:hypothetical protein